MAFLPSGSIPYQQYLNKYALSIVSHMKELGYSTTAMHPYNASGGIEALFMKRWDLDSFFP